MNSDVQLSVAFFETEAGYDPLTVNGVAYSGTSGPEGVSVTAGSTITFTSDSSLTKKGFEICLPLGMRGHRLWEDSGGLGGMQG